MDSSHGLPGLPATGTLRFGTFELDIETLELTQAGRLRPLRPQPARVLRYLASRPQQLVTREELAEHLWPDGIHVASEPAINAAVWSVRAALGDDARSPRFVETLARRGYRFIAPVEIIERADRQATPLTPVTPFTPVAPAADAPPPVTSSTARTRTWGLAALGVLAVLAVVAVLAWQPMTRGDREERRPRVAVLGFANLSGEPEANWLSTALSEMLTTELAVSEVVKAIPADTVARIKRELSVVDADRLDAPALRKLRAGLGVDYVVVGSYLAAAGEDAEALRIDLRLQDRRTGEIVTAVVETGTVSELADLVLLAGMHLRRALGEDEQLATQRASYVQPAPASPAASRLFYQGLLELRRFEVTAAIELLERSAEEEPRAAQTHFALAEAWSLLGYDRRAAEAGDRALALADDLPRENRLWMEARCHGLAARWDEAVERLRALRLLDPDNLDYGLELARVQLHSASLEDALATVTSLKAGRGSESVDPRFELLAAAAAAKSGDYARSIAEATRARERAHELGAPLLVGRALLHEATGLHSLGRVEEAEAALEEARTFFAEAGDRLSEASAAVTMAGWLWSRGAFERSEAMAREALAVYREIGNRAGEADALRQLALHVWKQGDRSRGERMFLEALATAREIGDRHGEAKTLNSLAIAAAAYGASANYGREIRPITLFEQALAIYRDLDDKEGICGAASNVGRCALIRGEVKKATVALEEALAAFRQLKISEGIGNTLFNLAYARGMTGDLAAAENEFLEASAIFRRVENPSMLASSLVGLGGVRMMAGKLQAADKDLSESLRLLKQIGQPIRIAVGLSALARLRVHQGDSLEAEKLAREAISMTAAAPRFYASEARRELAYVLLEAGRPADARAVLDQLPELRDPEAKIDVRLLAARITFARVLGATGEPALAREMLREVIAFTESKGMERLRLDAEIARLEIEHQTGGDPSVRRALDELAAESRRRKLMLLAQRVDRILATG